MDIFVCIKEITDRMETGHIELKKPGTIKTVNTNNQGNVQRDPTWFDNHFKRNNDEKSGIISVILH